MAIKTDLSSMAIGDKIICEYVATSGAFGTFSNLGTSNATNIPVASTATPNGSFYLIYVGNDYLERMILIADRNIQNAISWDTLNTAGVASGSGRPITLGDANPTVRLPTGGVSSSDYDNEWDKYIVSSSLNGAIAAGDNAVWNWNGAYSLTSTSTSAGANRTIRGNSAVGVIASATTAATGCAFRPVFVTVAPIKKYLFQDGTDIKSFSTSSSTWSVVGTAPATEAMFTTSGMNNLSAITDNVLNQLISATPQVLCYRNTTFAMNLNATGVPRVKYKYKVISDNSNQAVLKDYEAGYVDVNTSELITIAPSFFTSANPYTITVTAQHEDGTTVTSSGTVQLVDTKPAITASVTTGNTFNLTISDPESDQIQYLIKLNGNQVYPSTTGMTSLGNSPIGYTRTFKSNEILIGQNNVIHIDAQDQYGLLGSADLNFTGNYTGIMFSDDTGAFYSTDLGAILKYLDFGSLIASQTSDALKVNVKNLNPFSIKDTNIWLQAVVPSGITIEFSQGNAPFIGSSSITIPDTIPSSGTTSFYVRILTTRSAKSGGTFDVYAKANPV